MCRSMTVHGPISPIEKHMLHVCGAVNTFHETYSTSPAPLLVRNRSHVCGAVARNPRNTFISQLKKHRNSEVNCRELLVAPVPFIVGRVDMDIFLRCGENSRKYNEFDMLFMCSTERRVMKPRIPKPTSGHRSFFFF